MSATLASGLNPLAQSFVSIGYAAFTAGGRAIVNNDMSENATSQSPLISNSHFPEQQISWNIIDLDTVPNDCQESGLDEADDAPAAEQEYNSQTVYPEKEYGVWSDDFLDTEDQPQEDQLQIKSIELLCPSGFVPLPETDTSVRFHATNGQIQALQALLLDNPHPSRNPQLNNCQLHDTDFINNRPSKLYTTWLSHHLELSDHLLRNICPSDLNNTPCEWDELPTGCPLLRLCSTRRLYPIPDSVPKSSCAPISFSFLPPCHGAARQQCIYIHDITPNCRRIDEHVRGSNSNSDFRTVQACPIVAAQSIMANSEWSNDSFCTWGHDFEGARLESLWRYWEHRAQARRRGSVGLVKHDRRGRRVFVPKRPDVGSLVHVQEVKVKPQPASRRCAESRAMEVEMEIDAEREVEDVDLIGERSLADDEEEEEDDGYDLFEIDRTRFVGRTFHGHYVRLSFELGEKWTDGWYYTFRDLRALAQGLTLRERERVVELREFYEDEDEDGEDAEDGGEENESEYVDEYAALESSSWSQSSAVPVAQ